MFRRLCMAGFFLVLGLSLSAQSPQPQSSSLTGPLSTEDVIKKLVEKNRERAGDLREFEGTRVYELQYHGFPSDMEGKMTVSVTYHSPGKKQFVITSKSGSGFLFSHVLKKLLEGEQESSDPQNRRHTDLSPQNYDFQMVRYETTPAGSSYVMRVIPKSKNKFLYRGTVWIDAKDFALTRIEAAPAQNPSFWIKKTEVRHKYDKHGEFWLPAENHTVSFLRIGGRAVLTISYDQYKINQEAAAEAGTTSQPAKTAGPTDDSPR